MELELQVHKDATAAQIDALQQILSVYQDTRAEMRDEIRALRPKSSSEAMVNPTLTFGSLPPPGGTLAPLQRPNSASSSQGLALETGSDSATGVAPFRSLCHSEVILGFASEPITAPINVHNDMNSFNSTVAQTNSMFSSSANTLLNEKGESSGTKKPMDESSHSFNIINIPIVVFSHTINESIAWTISCVSTTKRLSSTSDVSWGTCLQH